MYIVSACLLGIECKYNGGHNRNQKVIDFLENKKYTAICPEIQGGLKSPRLPSEIIGNRVFSKDGTELTEAFKKGAEISWEGALKASMYENESLEGAILMPRSPSCGIGQIYDGSFSKKLVSGDGIAAAFLKSKGIKLILPEEL